MLLHKLVILKKIGLKKGEATAAQQAQREKFKLVVGQVKESLKDPDQKAEFEAQTKKGDTILRTAFKYFYALNNIANGVCFFSGFGNHENNWRMNNGKEMDLLAMLFLFFHYIVFYMLG